MKPQELAQIIKSEYRSRLPTMPVQLKPMLEELALYPRSYSAAKVNSLTSSIMKSILSLKFKPSISLDQPTTAGYRSSNSQQLSLQIVLEGMTAFRDAFLNQDPDNRFFIDRSADGTYERSTMIIGPVVRLSKVHSTGQYDVDGTYFKRQRETTGRSIILPGFLKGIVYSDSNNSYHLIAIQHDIFEESEKGYRHLFESMWREFPHTGSKENAYECDRDSGLLSYLRSRTQQSLQTPHITYCTVHLKRNVASKYPGKVNIKARLTAIKAFEQISTCKRKDQTLKRLGKLRDSEDSVMKELYDYLIQIGPEFFCDALMTECRPEKLTSNSIESLWSHTDIERSESKLPLFFKRIYNFAINKLYQTENLMEGHSEDFTPYACSHMHQRGEWGKKKGLRVLEFSETRVTGTITDGKNRLSCIDLTTMACTCQERRIQRIPCACQMILILRTHNLHLLNQCVHLSFHTASWGEALRAAIDHPSSLSPCSSNSLADFQRINLLEWAAPTPPTPESFRFPSKIGSAKGRPEAPTQNRQLDVRQWRGQKRAFHDRLRALFPESSSGDFSSGNDEESDQLTEEHSEEEVSQNANSGPCTGCQNETSNLHGCTICHRPTHIFCGQASGEEGYGQTVICQNCVAQEQEPRDVTLPPFRLRDPPGAKTHQPNPHLVFISSDGDSRRVYFRCIKCSNETAFVKFITFRKWDVFGYCQACHAKYKKIRCSTHPRTHYTTFTFQFSTDPAFDIPEISTGCSSEDDIHPHFRNHAGKGSQRARKAGRYPERERIPSQGDSYDLRNSAFS